MSGTAIFVLMTIPEMVDDMILKLTMVDDMILVTVTVKVMVTLVVLGSAIRLSVCHWKNSGRCSRLCVYTHLPQQPVTHRPRFCIVEMFEFV